MNHFQHFKTDISNINLPEKFTFPFYYEPHDLAKIGAKELQEYLENQTDFKHDFGFENNKNLVTVGKMFGVLVVQNQENELGYLAAFSGKLADKSLPKKFVPPVFNMRTEGSFYVKGEVELDELNREIASLKKGETFISLKKTLKKRIQQIEDDLAFQRKKMKIAKNERKIRKKNAASTFNESDFAILIKKLEQESFNDQFFYKELKEYYENDIQKQSEKLAFFEDKIKTLKKERIKKSNFLQQTLFENYAFVNSKKEWKSLLAIFDNPAIKPPAGAGECAAPKLLQYAFLSDLKPICMAEFWWGASPNSEIRKHQYFYPACQSRCKPILTHMLRGMKMDENLLIDNLSEHQEIPIIYEDNELIIINKPADFLSVPGKEISDSVFTRMKMKFPTATGPLIVHRLDMSTSGIMVLTKTKEANKILQSQFIKRTIKKRYVALLDGKLQEKSGKISLPIRLDLDDRPKQLVDFEFGKKAETFWEIIQIEEDKTRVYFYPITGRTHQLRVHSAHKNGLNAPIVGDDLYGKKGKRLCLHAEFIEFLHPKKMEKMSFSVAPEF